MIAFLSEQFSGCYWYRTHIPFFALNEDVIAICGNEKFSNKNVHALQLSRVYGAPMKDGVEFCHRANIKVVYDTDDAYDILDKENAFYESVKPRIDVFNYLLNNADEITTSTKKLAEHLKTLTDKKIHVIPNCINPDDWKLRDGNKGKLRIGFVGSSGHIADLNMVLPTIAKLQREYDFEFVIMGLGFVSGDYDKWFKTMHTLNDSVSTEAVKMDALLKDVKFEWVPFVDFKLYPEILRRLNLDIGICPLRGTKFDEMKSCVKFYEYSMVGTCCLASDVLPYSEEATCVTDNDKWYESLKDLIEDKHYRDWTLAKARHWVLKNRNIKKFIPKYRKIYNLPSLKLLSPQK